MPRVPSQNAVRATVAKREVAGFDGFIFVTPPNG